MNPFGRAVLLAMIPANAVLLLWVWLGRVLVGAAGWWVVIGFFLVPVAVLGLALTTVLAFRKNGTPRALTTAQAVVQLVMWAAMASLGFFLVDATDATDSDASVFTKLVADSDSAFSLSYTLTNISFLAAGAAWVALLVLLIAQKRGTALPGPGGGPHY